MEPAKITAIYDKTRVIKKNTTAKVQIAIERPVALETFETCKQFARFTLRYMSESVAAGIVQLIKQ
jgi:translation elongation factor EF-1alpha